MYPAHFHLPIHFDGSGNLQSCPLPLEELFSNKPLTMLWWPEFLSLNIKKCVMGQQFRGVQNLGVNFLGRTPFCILDNYKRITFSTIVFRGEGPSTTHACNSLKSLEKMQSKMQLKRQPKCQPNSQPKSQPIMHLTRQKGSPHGSQTDFSRH